MEDCIFCKIAAGKIGKLVYEDDLAVAFDDLNPQAPVHVLVIPRRHIARVSDVDGDADENLMGRLVAVANSIAVERGVADEGYRLVVNCNEGAGQSVWHVHLHLLGGRALGWPPG